MEDTREIARRLKCCAVVPTYNNAGSLKGVINDIMQFITDVIIVNDGSTDSTHEILASCSSLDIISYMPNRGKGYAIRQGFKLAGQKGFTYAITIDSDGQHKGSDIRLFLEKIQQSPDSIIVGSRLLKQENMPDGNTFANKFSNFWFRLQTGINLPDTQSGFRLYPLKKIMGIHFVTNRYEAELEMLVRSAWKGIKIYDVGISVYYPPPDERVTHFRPFFDFARISILNTFFTIIAFVYAYPAKLISKVFRRP